MLGLTAVLHTWARDLSFHPHLHCVVTGGALAADGTRWIKGSARYLFPVRVLSELFRGKLINGLGREWRAGRLRLDDEEPETFWRLRDALSGQSWVVCATRPFAGPESVFAYLGRYTHRVGISNRRLVHRWAGTAGRGSSDWRWWCSCVTCWRRSSRRCRSCSWDGGISRGCGRRSTC
jgi:hypothetical protein